MNVKSLTPSLTALDSRPRVDGKENVRLQDTGDRDANGQQQQSEHEQKRHLSDSEFDVALAALKENSAVKTHNLQVRVESQSGLRVVLIEDINGQVVRRLTEADLWTVTREKDRPTGKLLDKAG